MNQSFVFVLNLLCTFFLYGTGPLLFAKLHKRPTTKGRIKAFVAVYCVITWFSVNILLVLFSDRKVSSGGAAILWGWIFYYALKNHLDKTGRLVEKIPAIPKECYIQQETEMGQFVVDSETGEVIKEEIRKDESTEQIPQKVEKSSVESLEEFPQPIMPISSPEKKRRVPRSTVVLAVVCAIFAFITFDFAYIAVNYHNEKDSLMEENDRLKETISILEESKSRISKEKAELKQENAELQKEKQNLENKFDDVCYDWVDLMIQLNGIGFIVNNSRYYHNYECEIYTSSDEYWAHNVEYCEYLGYSKCPECW